ncbi:hypothetical protein MRB53_018368 [Persea americana]|uniref:Uncharacterized protein n=1 Tax=Persea americana TaxID=3435 RepID=A0ACC2M7U1_PERAE|nr:hypothetical protein MRB53_018368 [Persea americana]
MSLILKRARDSFILPIPMEKLKKPISRNLLIFRKIKTMKLLKLYSYTYIKEYQFSPPSTPPFNHSTGRFSFTNRTLQRILCSMLLLCHSPRSEGEEGEICNLEASVIFYDMGSEPMSTVLLESE